MTDEMTRVPRPRVVPGRDLLRWACVLALLAATVGGCSQGMGLDSGIRAAVREHEFDLLGWELSHGLEGSKAPSSAEGPLSEQAERAMVQGFFLLGRKLGALTPGGAVTGADGRLMSSAEVEQARQEILTQREQMRAAVQWILGRQVRAIYNELGIFNPVDRFVRVAAPFPPMNFRLARPPMILIVSPRERIESIREIMLDENLDVNTAGRIEEQVDALGVSSLVVEIGGLGATYPTFVADDASMEWTIETIAEEWLHQYMFFTPLGFLYALDGLGIRRDYDIATMNETVAGIVSSEVAERVLERFYGVTPAPKTPSTPPEQSSPDQFSFVREMRQTRLKVDELLAAAKVDQAEQYMELRRQEFVAHGYYIRKLNQAYFAFYGTYGDAPTSVSPIGTEMRLLHERVLREQAGSLAAFLNRVVSMTSRQDLEKATQ